jgi:putative SOS response-associated peptidase YedK
MCNLFATTTPQHAMRQLFRIKRDRTGNLPPMPAIFPDQRAPVVRIARDGERTLEMMRWGMPGPAQFGEKPCTNIRNPQSPHWRPWLAPRWRCLVPATSFCEYAATHPKVPHWFALDETRPTFAFAGLWRPWTGVRGTRAERRELMDLTGSEMAEHRLFSILTTAPNALVRPIHAEAMPVILTEDQWDTWLTAEVEDALRLQRPLAADALKIVARGEREDGSEGLMRQGALLF